MLNINLLNQEMNNDVAMETKQVQDLPKNSLKIKVNNLKDAENEFGMVVGVHAELQKAGLKDSFIVTGNEKGLIAMQKLREFKQLNGYKEAKTSVEKSAFLRDCLLDVEDDEIFNLSLHLSDKWLSKDYQVENTVIYYLLVKKTKNTKGLSWTLQKVVEDFAGHRSLATTVWNQTTEVEFLNLAQFSEEEVKNIGTKMYQRLCNIANEIAIGKQESGSLKDYVEAKKQELDKVRQENIEKFNKKKENYVSVDGLERNLKKF